MTAETFDLPLVKSIDLHCDGAAATVAPRGAELTRLRLGGAELIWPGHPQSWARSAPVLFPFCGWLNGGVFRHRGQTYASPVHGFGPDALFAARRLGAAGLHLHLTASAETLERFPFAFDLSAHFELGRDRLTLEYAVSNPGEVPLPFALGFHPGFRWPFAGGDKAAYRVEFSDDEAPHATRIAPGGLFTADTVPIPLAARRLDIADAASQYGSVVMLNARSRRVDFVAPDGSRIVIETRNFPHWVFWSLDGADFLCIEAWTGQGDPVGFRGEITSKPGMTLLAPGATAHFGFTIGYAPG